MKIPKIKFDEKDRKATIIFFSMYASVLLLSITLSNYLQGITSLQTPLMALFGGLFGGIYTKTAFKYPEERGTFMKFYFFLLFFMLIVVYVDFAYL